MVKRESVVASGNENVYLIPWVIVIENYKGVDKWLSRIFSAK